MDDAIFEAIDRAVNPQAYLIPPEEKVVAVIWANQNAPRPKSPYILLNEIDESEQGNASEFFGEIEEDTTGFRYTHDQDVVISINAYGSESKNAKDLIKKIIFYLEHDGSNDFLNEKKLVYVDKSNIRNISASVDRQFEDRRQVDITFRYADVVKVESEETIEKIEILQTVKVGEDEKTNEIIYEEETTP
jgi:hypothetical protein